MMHLTSPRVDVDTHTNKNYGARIFVEILKSKRSDGKGFKSSKLNGKGPSVLRLFVPFFSFAAVNVPAL